MEFVISTDSIISGNVSFVLEECAWPGVKTIANIVANDMSAVFGVDPSIRSIKSDEDYETVLDCRENSIIVGTVGKSDLLEKLEAAGKVTFDDIKSKREVYKFVFVDRKDEIGYTSLVIAGSDKRGTIYGLFHLSELMGVSPLTNWNKVVPIRKSPLKLDENDQIVSKEPSVKYRGFFINDEWPAFGNWSEKHFGGFTRDCYMEVFELLLRCKGNYFWPAMWSAIFSNDGPGLANAELADELGVIVGMSHHEPCCRNGEEYKYLRGPESIYGDAWNFRTNEQGITKFWEDGLKRNASFENVITVGMRGEADSTIMGEDATLKDNIDLLKDVLKCQNKLISENVNSNLDEVPRMLALYKEVEPFYYGDEKTEGLMNDPELDGVTLMLCDDNFGNLRTVPTDKMREHKGGFGMYYHFDYHGWPISFEWVNSSYLPKIWEQMTAAYEFGIRELWIVNVGDIFSTEYPLSFFLDLAYDYDKWGISNINAPSEYTKKWVKTQFVGTMSDEDLEETEELLNAYTKIASCRRPEAMNDLVFSAKNDEAAKHGELCESLMERCSALRSRIPQKIDFPFFQFVYYPLMGNLNVHKLWTDTTMNHFLTSVQASEASVYKQKVYDGLKKDRELVEELHTIADGRWYGMGMSEHIGFVHWNEEECRKPVLYEVEPANKRRLVAVNPATLEHTEGGDWTGRIIPLNIGTKEEKELGIIRLFSVGSEDVSFTVEVDSQDIAVSSECGNVKAYDHLDLHIYAKSDKADVSGNIIIRNEIGSHITVHATSKCNAVDLEKYDSIVIDAKDYVDNRSANGAKFEEIPAYGHYESAMKVFPVNKLFSEGTGPVITYEFEAPETAVYEVELIMAPSNPAYMDQKLYYGFGGGRDRVTAYNAVPDDYKIGDRQESWQNGVLSNMRTNKHEIHCSKGMNKINIQAISPNLVIERLKINTLK